MSFFKVGLGGRLGHAADYDAEGGRTLAVSVSRSLAQRILSALTLSTTKEHSLWKQPEFSNDLKANTNRLSSIWGAIMQTLRRFSLGSSRCPGRIPGTTELLASCAVSVECLVGSFIIAGWFYAAVVPVPSSFAKMQSTTNHITVLKGDRLDRTAAMRADPMKMKVVSRDQKLLIGCEPAFSKFAVNRDRRAARCLT